MVGVVNGIDSILLFTLVVTPFFGAIVVAFFPADKHDLIHWYSRIIATTGLVIAAYLFVMFDTSADLSKYTVDYDWLPSLGCLLYTSPSPRD